MNDQKTGTTPSGDEPVEELQNTLLDLCTLLIDLIKITSLVNAISHPVVGTEILNLAKKLIVSVFGSLLETCPSSCFPRPIDNENIRFEVRRIMSPGSPRFAFYIKRHPDEDYSPIDLRIDLPALYNPTDIQELLIALPSIMVKVGLELKARGALGEPISWKGSWIKN
jgi:hypothetical protein